MCMVGHTSLGPSPPPPKRFSGWTGDAQCNDESDDRCVGGVGTAALEQSKQALLGLGGGKSRFLLLITGACT